MVEKFMESIIDNLPNALFAINTKGEIVIWNKAIEEMTGTKREEVLGKGNYEYSYIFYGERVPGLVDALLDNTSEVEKRYINFKREGNKVTGERPFKNKTFLRGLATVLYDKDGNKILGEMVYIKDITVEKELEVCFSKIFYDNPLAMVIMDNETGIIIKANKAFSEILETDKPVLGTTLRPYEMIIMGSIDEIKNILNSGKKVQNYKLDIRVNDKIKYLTASCIIITVEERECILSILNDVTKQKELTIYLDEIKKEHNEKIKKYISEQKIIFNNMMDEQHVDIKSSIESSQNMIRKMLLNGNGG